MNDEWICKEMGREFSLLFWSLLSFYSELYQEVFNKAGLEGSEAA